MNALYACTRTSVLLVLLVLAAGGAQAGTPPGVVKIKDSVKKSYDVRPGGTLSLDLDQGNIEVEAAQGNRVLIEVERIADAEDREEAQEMLKRHDLSFEQDGSEVSVRSRFSEEEGLLGRWRNSNNLKIRIIVQVPEQFNLDFSSGAGNIDILNIDGEVEGKTGAGNIVLRGVRGVVDVSSGAGNIDVSGDIEEAEVHTGAGNIDLKGLTGTVEANTGAGNVYAEITRQPEGASDLSSGAGNVTALLASRVGVYVDASAALGSVDTDFPLKVEGKWLKKSCEGKVNGGGPELRLHTGVGNVSIKRKG